MSKSIAEQKREALLVAAMTLFLERGFAAVSLDDVLAATGGSKATVYRYFGSKDGLFQAVIVRICENALHQMRMLDLGAMSLREALIQHGLALLNLLADPVAVEAYRLAIAEAPRHPDAARAYYHAAPEAAARLLADFLAAQQRAGHVRADAGDPYQLACLFIDGLVHHRLMQALLGVAAVPLRDAYDPFLNQAATIFLRGIQTPEPRGLGRHDQP